MSTNTNTNHTHTLLLPQANIQHKMNWFDPEVLNRIALRLGTVDALMKSPQLQARGGGDATGAQLDQRELEGQMRRWACVIICLHASTKVMDRILVSQLQVKSSRSCLD